MNLTSLVTVALRLIALNSMLLSAIQMAPTLVNLALASSRQTTDLPLAAAALPYLVILALFASGVAVWFFAASIARLITRGVDVHLSFGSLALADCYTVAFSAMGLYFVGAHLAQVLSWTYFLFKKAAESTSGEAMAQVNFYEPWAAYVPFVLGVALLAKARNWADRLAAARHTGARPSDTR